MKNISQRKILGNGWEKRIRGPGSLGGGGNGKKES